ncbi:maestro heat-like repeat family member 5 isoform X3 [Sus scrofa]|uniref:maestro heat-like repeat family member 5 isoform X3 n=1 Tax=Sus scrofa TaxID=9823 RepID=UPI000A2B4ED0|nr:maestro heat-like repeat family member 5 isoform X3 [Sus scrofa]
MVSGVLNKSGEVRVVRLKPRRRQTAGLSVHCAEGETKGSERSPSPGVAGGAWMLQSLEEQEGVRGEAILLYGDVIHSGGKKFRQQLKNHAFQALVPLLLHLADSCPDVVMKTKFTFLRCALLLKWEFRKELFGKLAWGRGLGAENDIFIYMVESNFGSYHQFLMQALVYLSSPNRCLKVTAMKFIGGILQDYFTDLCFHLKRGDVKTLRKYFEMVKQDPDSTSRKFYKSFVEDMVELSQFVLL